MKQPSLKKLYSYATEHSGLLLLILLGVFAVTVYVVNQRTAVTTQKSQATRETSCSLTIRISPPPTGTPSSTPTPICVPPPTGTPGPTPVLEQNCTFTLGYWKTHQNAWPVPSVTLGTVLYTQAQLLSIFGQPVAGNGLISLAHQLIAAKLNIAAGTDSESVAAAIAQADSLIGSLIVPPVGAVTLTTAQTSQLITVLDNFNNGRIGPGHCGN